MLPLNNKAACTRARAARAHHTLRSWARAYTGHVAASICAQAVSAFPILPRLGGRSPLLELEGFCGGSGLWLRSGAGRAQLATSRITGPVLAASSTSEMLYRSQWSRSGLSECIHVAVDGHHLMPV